MSVFLDNSFILGIGEFILIFSSITIGGVKIEFLVALLITAALYFTFRTGVIGFWGFKHAVKLITNKFLYFLIKK